MSWCSFIYWVKYSKPSGQNMWCMPSNTDKNEECPMQTFERISLKKKGDELP